MGPDFLKRVQRATAVVGATTFLIVAVYYDVAFGFGLLIGCFWGIANFWALTRVLTAVVTPEAINRRRAYIFAAIKFPVLYVIGYLILRSGWFPPVSLIVGFSLLFLVVLLKASGRALMHLDERVPSKGGQPGHRPESPS